MIFGYSRSLIITLSNLLQKILFPYLETEKLQTISFIISISIMPQKCLKEAGKKALSESKYPGEN